MCKSSLLWSGSSVSASGKRGERWLLLGVVESIKHLDAMVSQFWFSEKPAGGRKELEIPSALGEGLASSQTAASAEGRRLSSSSAPCCLQVVRIGYCMRWVLPLPKLVLPGCLDGQKWKGLGFQVVHSRNLAEARHKVATSAPLSWEALDLPRSPIVLLQQEDTSFPEFHLQTRQWIP